MHTMHRWRTSIYFESRQMTPTYEMCETCEKCNSHARPNRENMKPSFSLKRSPAYSTLF